LVRDNLAIRDLGVVAYAGIPLISAEEEVLGSFCAIDKQPRAWAKSDLDVLRHFAASTMDHIEGRSPVAA
jgi:GAF domain-containing protein